MSSKNILIATRNKDKFQILKNLLIAWNKPVFGPVNFYSLVDFDIFDQTEETGDLLNRALQKAKNAYEILSGITRQVPKIDWIIGSDDGMKYHDQPTNPDSKVVTRQILYENLLQENDTLTIVRAFVFLDKDGNVLTQFETKIPFRYKNNSESLSNQGDKYPLEQVVTPMHDERFNTEISAEEMTNYYLQFCKEGFVKHISFIPAA